MVPKDLKYTKEHEWLRVEGDEVVLGITEHAQEELGDITFIDLPWKGQEIKLSDSLAVIESVKAASDIYAPVDGSVVEINEALKDAPEIINSSPYNEGWICRINLTEADQLSGLMDAASYEKYIKEGAGH